MLGSKPVSSPLSWWGLVIAKVPVLTWQEAGGLCPSGWCSEHISQPSPSPCTHMHACAHICTHTHTYTDTRACTHSPGEQNPSLAHSYVSRTDLPTPHVPTFPPAFSPHSQLDPMNRQQDLLQPACLLAVNRRIAVCYSVRYGRGCPYCFLRSMLRTASGHII